MTEHPHHLDRETAEHLLSGGSATAHPELSGLLASAAAPAQAPELSGEFAAMAAFRAAQQTRTARPRRLRRLLIFKISAIAAMVTAGGLAFASGTGLLPSPFEPAPPASPSSPSPSITPSLLPSSGAVAPAEVPPDSLPGLCQAYHGKPLEERGKALESTAFQRLVGAAGGAGKVDAYCAALPGGKAEKSPEAPAQASMKARPTTPPPAITPGSPETPGTPSHPAGNTNPRRGAVGGELPSPSDKDSICADPGSPAC